MKRIFLTVWGVLLLGVAGGACGEDIKPATRPDGNNLAVAIKSVRLDYVKLKKVGESTFDDSHSQDKVLIFTLEITNKGQKEVAYKTFNGAPGGKGDYASLIDSKRKFVALGDFGEMEPQGITRAATLKPGETITDVLVFGRPPDGAKPNILLLPAKNHGGVGLWKLEVKVEPTLE